MALVQEFQAQVAQGLMLIPLGYLLLEVVSVDTLLAAVVVVMELQQVAHLEQVA
jgi:hypothetical protein